MRRVAVLAGEHVQRLGARRTAALSSAETRHGSSSSSSAAAASAGSGAAVGLAALVIDASEDSSHVSPFSQQQQQQQQQPQQEYSKTDDNSSFASHVVSTSEPEPFLFQVSREELREHRRALAPQLSPASRSLMTTVCDIVEDPDVRRSFLENKTFQRILERLPSESARGAPRLMLRAGHSFTISPRRDAESDDESEDDSFASDSTEDPDAATLPSAGNLPASNDEERDAWVNATALQLCANCERQLHAQIPPVPRALPRDNGCAGSVPEADKTEDLLHTLIPLAAATILGILLVRLGPATIMKVGGLLKRVDLREWGRSLTLAAFESVRFS